MADEILEDDYRARIMRIEIAQEQTHNLLNSFIDETNKREELRAKQRHEERFTRKDMVTYALGLIGAMSTTGLGAIWFINTQVSPVALRLSEQGRAVETSIATVQNTMNERFKTQAGSTDERFTSVGDTIRAIRKDNTDIQIAIGETKVELTRVKDTASDNRERILAMEQRAEADRRRDLDAKAGVR